MKLRQLLLIGSIIFALLASLFGYKLYKSIQETLILTKAIKENEEEVKNQLVFLKEMELAYFHNNKKYTDSWDTLTDFIKNDTLFNIDKHENIVNLYAGRDSSFFTYDTISYAKIYDSLFIKNKIGVTIDTYNKLPHRKKSEYRLKIGDLDGVKVFEICDTIPLDSKRENGTIKKLKIGSLKSATIKGSWEK